MIVGGLHSGNYKVCLALRLMFVSYIYTLTNYPVLKTTNHVLTTSEKKGNVMPMYIRAFLNRRKEIYAHQEFFGSNTVYQYYLFKMIVLGKISSIDADREMGKQCKYPKCCVDNFVKLRKLGLSPAAWMRDTYGESENSGYVQCLKCRVPLKGGDIIAAAG